MFGTERPAENRTEAKRVAASNSNNDANQKNELAFIFSKTSSVCSDAWTPPSEMPRPAMLGAMCVLLSQYPRYEWRIAVLRAQRSAPALLSSSSATGYSALRLCVRCLRHRQIKSSEVLLPLIHGSDIENTSMQKSKLVSGIFSLIVGGIALIAAMLTYQDTENFLRISSSAPGKVTALNHGSSHPEIEFTSKAGEKISYSQGGFIFGMRVGDAVHVRYLAAAPRPTARLDRFGSIWFWTLTTGMFFVAFSTIGIVTLIQFSKNRHKAIR